MAKKKEPVVHYGTIKLPYTDKWYYQACKPGYISKNCTKDKSKVVCRNCRRTKIFRGVK